jgi:hypothetical protein
VRRAINAMELGKAAGVSEFVAEQSIACRLCVYRRVLADTTKSVIDKREGIN